MALTAFNRYLCIKKRNLCDKIFTKKRTLFLIAAIWIVVLIINGFPNLLSLNDFSCPGYLLEKDDESSCYLLVQRLALWLLRDLILRYTGVLLESVSNRRRAQRGRSSESELSKSQYPGWKQFWGSVCGEGSGIYRVCFHHLLDTVRSNGHYGQDKPTSFTSSGEIILGQRECKVTFPYIGNSLNFLSFVFFVSLFCMLHKMIEFHFGQN